MTVVAERKPQLAVVGCEVRFRETGEVVGYLVTAAAAGALEQALTENGFWLVPARSESTIRAHALA